MVTQEALLSHAITACVAILGSAATFTMLLRGFWVTKITPMVLTEIKNHADSKEQREERLAEMSKSMHLPAVKKELEDIMHTKIDNEIKRSDGLIANEITSAVDGKMQAVEEKLAKIELFFKEDSVLKSQLLQRLARMEGAISGSKASHESTASFHAVKDPNSKP